MQIGPFETDRRVLIIAEIGNNHEGSVKLAEAMIARAAEAGADAVKFQTIVPDRLVAPSQKERIAQLRRICLLPEVFPHLKEVADAHDVLFLSTPFDVDSVPLLDPLVIAFKIASADNDFFPLLHAVAATRKPVLLSTGLCDLSLVHQARKVFKTSWSGMEHEGQLGLLHCISSYPTPPEQANLRVIRQLKELGTSVGYSDHTLGIETAVISVAMGARIVEKHFTLDKNQSDFRDHQLSADPEEFAQMVDRIRAVERMLGSGLKRLLPCESDIALQARRSAVAASDLSEGSVLEQKQILWVRPGGGIPPTMAMDLSGKRLRHSINKGELLSPADIDW